jgi:hypothetical protein
MKQLGGGGDFDSFRRERNQRRNQSGTPHRAIAKGQEVLREIEAAEARELQDQRLTREVHDFFQDATRTAAGIMQKVNETAAEQTGQRMRYEVEEFLQDAIRRAQSFIELLRRCSTGREGETNVEPMMRNLIGDMLDQFRNEGTAQLQDKHLGQDPFATSPEAVREELTGRGEDEPAAPPVEHKEIEEHLVAEVMRNAKTPSSGKHPAHKQAAAPADGAAAANPLLASLSDPKRLKHALRALVQGGVLGKDEAQRIYEAQQQAPKS